LESKIKFWIWNLFFDPAKFDFFIGGNMQHSQALASTYVGARSNSILQNFLLVGLSVAMIAALAQVHIYLPFTPVPITGQTFAVALSALMLGRVRATASVFTYLGLGALGLPVFASAHAGLAWGPSIGYLFGMLVASALMGFLADRGWTKTPLKSWLAAFLGSVVIFSCGVLVLSFFVPGEKLLLAGVLPFLPGDALKTILASQIAYRAQKLIEPHL
jgi:biotin transport system substrate-specific component